MTRIHRTWARMAGLPADHFQAAHTSALMRHEIFHAHERGDIADAAFFDHIRVTHDLPLDDAQLLEGWNSIFIGEMAGIRDVLSRLHGKKPLFVFSNTNAPHYDHWSVRFADLLAPFERIYVSNQLRARKPDTAAFSAVIADMGMAAERVLFFDDSAVNVAGARAAGLQAVHTISTDDVVVGLQQAGLRFDAPDNDRRK